MLEKRFVLCESDHIYVERFMEYVQRKANFLFTIYGFTDVDQMEVFLEDQEVELGLIEERLWAELSAERRQALQTKIRYPSMLSEQRSGMDSGVIFRYQSMDRILRELVLGYEQHCPEPETEGSRTRTVAFWSPVGSCGQTTCALLLGQCLARRQGLRVLYVNLEAFPGVITGLSGQAGNSLSDHLYFRRMEESGQRIMSLTDTVGSISVIAPAVNPEDLWEASSEELWMVIDGIRNSGIYDLIVLDLGIQGNPVPILTECDRIILIGREEPMAKAKVEQAQRYLTQESVGISTQRLRVLVPPVIPEMRQQPAGRSCQELEDWLEKEWITWDSNWDRSMS